MAMTRDNYWGLCGEIGASSFSGIISGSGFRRRAIRKSVTRAIGCDGALRLHLQSPEFQIHYLVGSQTLIALSEMGNAILD